jgi:hypothetical protein
MFEYWYKPMDIHYWSFAEKTIYSFFCGCAFILIFSGCGKSSTESATNQTLSGRLTGTIIDSYYKTPIWGAKVGSSRPESFTDTLGKFEIDSLPSGAQRVVISDGGYEDLMDSVEILGGKTTSYSAALKAWHTSFTIGGLGTFYSRNGNTTTTDSVSFLSASLVDRNDNDSIIIHILVRKIIPVPYVIEVATDKSSEVAYCIVQPNSLCKTYFAKNGIGSVTIKITSFFPKLQGTFSGNLQLDGGSETISVTNGEFSAQSN